MKTTRFTFRPAAAWTLALSIFAVTLTVNAANRGGVQAVVFPNWNPASVSNLTAAVNEAAPSEFELSQCPFFGSGEERWANTVAFLRNINGTTKIVGTFFLSFHTDQPGYDLGARAGNLNTFLTTARAQLGYKAPITRFSNIVICPQLEDSYSDSQWKDKVKLMLDRLDEFQVLRSGKLTLRRSVQSQGSSLEGAVYIYRRGANAYSLRIHVEKHGIASVPSNGSWSNDGDFVFYPNNVAGSFEDATSFNSNRSGPLANFVAAARKRSGAATLWRPAMNLADRRVVNHKIVWTKSDLPAWRRTDPNTAFDAREKLVLKAFLNGLK